MQMKSYINVMSIVPFQHIDHWNNSRKKEIILPGSKLFFLA